MREFELWKQCYARWRIVIRNWEYSATIHGPLTGLSEPATTARATSTRWVAVKPLDIEQWWEGPRSRRDRLREASGRKGVLAPAHLRCHLY